MSVKIVNKQRPAGYIAEGPNDNPLKHISLVKNLKHIEANITTSFDVSGSQNCKGGLDLLNYMKFCRNTGIKTSIYPFGDNGVMTSFNSIEKFTDTYNTTKQFTTLTMTSSLIDCLEKSKERNINKFVFIGDGCFGGAYTSRETETNIFINRLNEMNLTHIQEIKLVFSPHTRDNIMDFLKNAIFKILSSSKNAIKVSCIKLPYLYRNEDYIYNIYKEMSKSIEIPKGHTMVGNLFTFNTKMTDKNLAKTILENFEEIIEPLEKYVKFIIQNQPHLLLIDNNIYSKLHNVLKIIIKDPYLNWISLEKGSAEGDKLKALTELLDNSYNKEAEIDELFEKIKKYIIGIGIFPDSQVTNKEILEMLKDGSCIMTKNFISNSLKSDRLIFKPLNGEEPKPNSWLIVRPRKNSDGGEYIEILRLSLKTLFLQFGSYLIEGNRTFIAALSMIMNGDSLGSEKKIPPLIRRVLMDAIFYDKDYTFKMLGFDVKSDELLLADNLCSPPIMNLVARSIINYPEKLLGSIGKQEKRLIYIMKKFMKVQNIVKTFRTKMTDFKLKREIRVKVCDIEIGNIALVKNYKLEPQINLSAVVIIRKLRKSKKKKKWVADGEYLDRGMDLILKDIRYGIPLNQLVILSSIYDKTLLDKLNNHLMKQQKEGDEGIYTGTYKGNEMERNLEESERLIILGKKMMDGAIYDAEFRHYNDNEIKEIIKIFLEKEGRTNNTGYNIVDIDVPVPKDDILKILKYSFKLNDKLLELLKSGSKLNKNDVIACSEIMYKYKEQDINLKPFVYKENDFILTDSEQDDIKKLFSDNLKNNTITLASSSSSKLCSICIEEKKINEFTYYEECNHAICIECKDYYDKQIIYKPGSLVNIMFHKCCICNHLQKSTLTDDLKCIIIDKYKGTLPDKIKLTYCLECNDLFETELHCGMSEDEIPNLCENHRIKEDDHFKQCPDCGQFIEKDGGCDHIECLNLVIKDGEYKLSKCGSHWCWGCKRKFSERILPIINIVNWECDGPCSDETEERHL